MNQCVIRALFRVVVFSGIVSAAVSTLEVPTPPTLSVRGPILSKRDAVTPLQGNIPGYMIDNTGSSNVIEGIESASLYNLDRVVPRNFRGTTTRKTLTEAGNHFPTPATNVSDSVTATAIAVSVALIILFLLFCGSLFLLFYVRRRKYALAILLSERSSKLNTLPVHRAILEREDPERILMLIADHVN